jgi:hypothetical protein
LVAVGLGDVVAVAVGDAVAVGVSVGVFVVTGVSVEVLVAVLVGVMLAVFVGVSVGVLVGVPSIKFATSMRKNTLSFSAFAKAAIRSTAGSLPALSPGGSVADGWMPDQSLTNPSRE